MRNIIASALEKVEGSLNDEFPASIRKAFRLAEKNFALSNIHFPRTVESLKEARRRLVFEELFYIKMALSLMREKIKWNSRGLYLNGIIPN